MMSEGSTPFISGTAFFQKKWKQNFVFPMSVVYETTSKSAIFQLPKLFTTSDFLTELLKIELYLGAA